MAYRPQIIRPVRTGLPELMQGIGMLQRSVEKKRYREMLREQQEKASERWKAEQEAKRQQYVGETMRKARDKIAAGNVEGARFDLKSAGLELDAVPGAAPGAAPEPPPSPFEQGTTEDAVGKAMGAVRGLPDRPPQAGPVAPPGLPDRPPQAGPVGEGGTRQRVEEALGGQGADMVFGPQEAQGPPDRAAQHQALMRQLDAAGAGPQPRPQGPPPGPPGPPGPPQPGPGPAAGPPPQGPARPPLRQWAQQMGLVPQLDRAEQAEAEAQDQMAQAQARAQTPMFRIRDPKTGREATFDPLQYKREKGKAIIERYLPLVEGYPEFSEVLVPMIRRAAQTGDATVIKDLNELHLAQRSREGRRDAYKRLQDMLANERAQKREERFGETHDRLMHKAALKRVEDYAGAEDLKKLKGLKDMRMAYKLFATGNPATQQRAAARLRNALESGVMTDKDFMRYTGILGFVEDLKARTGWSTDAILNYTRKYFTQGDRDAPKDMVVFMDEVVLPRMLSSIEEEVRLQEEQAGGIIDKLRQRHVPEAEQPYYQDYLNYLESAAIDPRWDPDPQKDAEQGVRAARGKLPKEEVRKIATRHKALADQARERYGQIDVEDVKAKTVEIAKKVGIPEQILLATVDLESSFDPYKVNVNDNGSVDRGAAQLNNQYDEGRNVTDPFNLEQNLTASAKFLKRKYNKHGSWRDAVQAYNPGAPDRIENISSRIDKYGGWPQEGVVDRIQGGARKAVDVVSGAADAVTGLFGDDEEAAEADAQRGLDPEQQAERRRAQGLSDEDLLRAIEGG